MRNPVVAVVNRSTILADAAVQAAVAALQEQVTKDFAPHWGRTATVKFYSSPPPATAWVLGIFDNSDQAGALGYHDATAHGLPLGKVFAATDAAYKLSWTVTASHELLEMLADPDVSLTAQLDAHSFVAYEVGDPVESDNMGYLTSTGIKVSNFVYPAWFEAYNTTGPYDHQGVVTAPLTMAPGGYVSVWTPAHGWGQRFADEGEVRYEARARVGSRRERRGVPRSEWLRSTA